MTELIVVSLACVTGWKRRGYIVLTPDGLVDVPKSNRRLAARPTMQRGGYARVRPTVGGRAIAGAMGVDEKTVRNASASEAEKPKQDSSGSRNDSAPGASPSKNAGVEADGADPATWSRQEALRRREVAQAVLAQIEADRAAGLVVPIGTVADAVRKEYGIVRTALLGLASKLAARLAATTTPEACGALVDGEVRSILEALSADGAA
jgi:hypothetical protein